MAYGDEESGDEGAPVQTQDSPQIDRDYMESVRRLYALTHPQPDQQGDWGTDDSGAQEGPAQSPAPSLSYAGGQGNGIDPSGAPLPQGFVPQPQPAQTGEWGTDDSGATPPSPPSELSAPPQPTIEDLRRRYAAHLPSVQRSASGLAPRTDAEYLGALQMPHTYRGPLPENWNGSPMQVPQEDLSLSPEQFANLSPRESAQLDVNRHPGPTPDQTDMYYRRMNPEERANLTPEQRSTWRGAEERINFNQRQMLQEESARAARDVQAARAEALQNFHRTATPQQRFERELQGAMQHPDPRVRQSALATYLHMRTNQVQLSQQEEMRLQRMSSAIDGVNNDQSLSPAERQSIITQLRTGIDPLHQRQQQATYLQTQATTAATLAQNQLQRRLNDMLVPGSNTNTVILNRGTGREMEMYFDGSHLRPVERPPAANAQNMDNPTPTPAMIADVSRHVGEQIHNNLGPVPAAQFPHWARDPNGTPNAAGLLPPLTGAALGEAQHAEEARVLRFRTQQMSPTRGAQMGIQGSDPVPPQVHQQIAQRAIQGTAQDLADPRTPLGASAAYNIPGETPQQRASRVEGLRVQDRDRRIRADWLRVLPQYQGQTPPQGGGPQGGAAPQQQNEVAPVQQPLQIPAVHAPAHQTMMSALDTLATRANLAGVPEPALDALASFFGIDVNPTATNRRASAREQVRAAARADVDRARVILRTNAGGALPAREAAEFNAIMSRLRALPAPGPSSGANPSPHPESYMPIGG